MEQHSTVLLGSVLAVLLHVGYKSLSVVVCMQAGVSAQCSALHGPALVS